MMKRLRILLPSLGLAALIATGCVLISGQFVFQIDLGDVTVDSVTPVQGLYVDLSKNSTYNKHKNEIKSLEDLALVGAVHNTGASSVTLSVYLLDGNPGPQPAGTITSTGIRVWGPITVASGATDNIDWDRSAALFGAGKAPLFDRIKSGAAFTLYAVSSAAPFQFDIKNAVFIVVVGAGK